MNLEFFSEELTHDDDESHIFLFNSVRHLRLQSKEGWRRYEICDGVNVHVRIFLNINGDQAFSPLRATFGSVEIFKNVSPVQLTSFFQWIEKDLKSRDVKTILIKHYPDTYNPEVYESISECFAHLGYASTEEVSSILKVSDIAFEKKIKPSERQKLNKAAAELIAEQVTIDRLEEIYLFIDQCRTERNQSLSMSLNHLAETVESFPENFFLFGASKNGELAAAAIVIKVNEQVLYTFYYAHDSRFNKISPVVLLMSKIYTFAQEEKYLLIDLGTSMLGDSLNEAVFHFKTSIGGEVARKTTFEKIIE